MIVLDENIFDYDFLPEYKSWYKGKITTIRDLRVGTLIKDDAIPTILRSVKQPTFVTTNVFDFWRRLPAHNAYCIICFELPNERIREISGALRKILLLKEFNTKAARMGKMLRVRHNHIDYCEAGSNKIFTLLWSTL
jgi:hypothetical protein